MFVLPVARSRGKIYLLPPASSCVVELDTSPVFNSNTACDRKSIRLMENVPMVN